MSNTDNFMERLALSDLFNSPALERDKKINQILRKSIQICDKNYQEICGFQSENMSEFSRKELNRVLHNRRQDKHLLNALLFLRGEMRIESARDIEDTIKAVEGLLGEVTHLRGNAI